MAKGSLKDADKSKAAKEVMYIEWKISHRIKHLKVPKEWIDKSDHRNGTVQITASELLDNRTGSTVMGIWDEMRSFVVFWLINLFCFRYFIHN